MRLSFLTCTLTAMSPGNTLMIRRLIDTVAGGEMPEFKICKSDELKEGTAQIVTVDNIEMGLIRHKGHCYAYRNLCAHQGGPACEGLRVPQVVDVINTDGTFVQQLFDEDDMHIVCPWHGYE